MVVDDDNNDEGRVFKRYLSGPSPGCVGHLALAEQHSASAAARFSIARVAAKANRRGGV